jgi:hypothetical protein
MSVQVHNLKHSSTLANRPDMSKMLGLQHHLPRISIIDIGPASCGLKDLGELQPLNSSGGLLRAACTGHTVACSRVNTGLFQ